jgi:hypothetical protein
MRRGGGFGWAEAGSIPSRANKKTEGRVSSSPREGLQDVG